jgi:hypothetical protein
MLANTAGTVDIATIASQAVGVAGAVVTAVIGLIKNKLA